MPFFNINSQTIIKQTKEMDVTEERWKEFMSTIPHHFKIDRLGAIFNAWLEQAREKRPDLVPKEIEVIRPTHKYPFYYEFHKFLRFVIYMIYMFTIVILTSL